MQRLDAQTRSGEQSVGFRPVRCLANLPEQPKQGLAGLRGERLESPELNRLQIADIPGDSEGGLHLGQRAPRRIQESPVVTGPSSGRTFCDVQRNAIARPSQLIGERSLLELRKLVGGSG